MQEMRSGRTPLSINGDFKGAVRAKQDEMNQLQAVRQAGTGGGGGDAVIHWDWALAMAPRKEKRIQCVLGTAVRRRLRARYSTLLHYLFLTAARRTLTCPSCRSEHVTGAGRRCRPWEVRPSWSRTPGWRSSVNQHRYSCSSCLSQWRRPEVSTTAPAGVGPCPDVSACRGGHSRHERGPGSPIRGWSWRHASDQVRICPCVTV